MKKLLISLLAMMAMGCENAPMNNSLSPKSNYSIVKIEGCEYLECDTYAGHYVYTHKGNCSNPIHLTPKPH